MSRPEMLRSLPCVVAAASAVGLMPVALAETPLPEHPDVLKGTLDNGLSYWVLRHDNPPDRASVWMHVSTGSMNETEEQRGIAHYLEHMAFNGSANFDGNEVIDFFQSIGLRFGEHQNAFTSFDQTTYQLALPDNTPETLGKGLLFYSDVLGKLTLSPEEIDNERGVILEEMLSSYSADRRVQEELFKRIAPGSRFSERLPIGVEETINAFQREDFVAYYTEWYTPSNTTLLVVADMDTQVVVDLIEAYFGDYERLPRPQDADASVAPYTKPVGIVITDPEYTRGSLGMIALGPVRPSVVMEEQYRDRLVEQMAIRAFNERLGDKIAAGEVPFRSAGADASDLFSAFRQIGIYAEGEPTKWRPMLEAMTTELRRAVLHGFTEQEVDDVRRDFIAGAEQMVRAEPTMNARFMLFQMLGAVVEDAAYMNASQQLALLGKYHTSISHEEVSAAFTALFSDQVFATYAMLPAGPGIPTEQQLVDISQQGLASSPPADASVERATSLLSSIPEPASIDDVSVHEPTDVASAWLGNGARVHHRFMDYKRDEVVVVITLAGGEILETPEQHGMTGMSTIAWQRPATSELSSVQIGDLMVGRNVRVGGGAGSDALILFVSGSPADLEPGMQLAYLMLTDPAIEEAAWNQQLEAARRAIAGRKLQPRGVAQEVGWKLLHDASDPRGKPLEIEDLDRVTREQAQAWLSRVIAAAPIEVTIVGDIDRDRAFDLAARYVGSLPKRARISESTLDASRQRPRPTGPLQAWERIETETDNAIVRVGFFGADADDVRDVRHLEVASRILSTRMIEELRENQQLVYGIGVGSAPGVAYPGYGMVTAGSTTEPGKSATLRDEIIRMYREFASNGPTEQEMEVVKLQLANALDESMKEPRFWVSVMQDMTYRGSSLDDVLGAPEAFQSFTGEEIRDTFARYFNDESLFWMIIEPERDSPEE
jgi:zinc protease